MRTKEHKKKEAELTTAIIRLPGEKKRELLSFITWITANRAAPNEITAEMARRIGAALTSDNSFDLILPEEVTRITWKIKTDEVLRREEYCKKIRFPELDDSPIHQKALTIAGIYEAGRINGIRSERARRKNKVFKMQ